MLRRPLWAVLGEIGGRQTSVGLLLDELLKQRRNVVCGWWGGGGVGVPRSAQPAGVLRLVLGEEPAEHTADALVHQVYVAQVPTGVADLELGQMAVSVRHLEAATADDEGVIALFLRARLGPGECKAHCGTVW